MKASSESLTLKLSRERRLADVSRLERLVRQASSQTAAGEVIRHIAV